MDIKLDKTIDVARGPEMGLTTKCKKGPTSNNKINYNFLLKCLAGLTVTAVVVNLGVTLALALKTAGPAALISLAATASISPLFIVAGIIAIAGLIGIICLSSYLFARRAGHSSYQPRMFTPSPIFPPAVIIHPGPHHGHHHHAHNHHAHNHHGHNHHGHHDHGHHHHGHHHHGHHHHGHG